MAVNLKLDKKRKRLSLALRSGTEWRVLEICALTCLDSKPALADWSWVIDFGGAVTEAGPDDTARFDKAFNLWSSDRRFRPVTALVVPSRQFGGWADLIASGLGERHYIGACSQEEAHTLIDDIEGFRASISPLL